MNNEEIYHLIDLVSQRMTALLMNESQFRLMSDSDKLEAIKFDRDLSIKLNDMLKDEEDEN